MTLDETEAINLLRESLKIYSPSGKEAKIAEFYKTFLKNNSWKVLESSVGNVIGIKGKGKPILLLSSHIDTISPNLPFVEKDNKFYARGAVDCKPAWIAILYSAVKFNWEQIFEKIGSGTIILLGVVKEEDDTIGIEDFFKMNINPDYAIFGEPTLINRICHAYRGRLWLNVTTNGEVGHASSCWNYTNPIEVMMDFWDELKKIGIHYKKPICEEDDNTNHFNELSISLTSIHSGDLGNSIPDKCEASIDIRVPMEENIDDIIKKVEEIKQKTEHTFNSSIEIVYKSKIKPVSTNPRSILINALRWAIFQITQEKGKLLKKTGTTFMNQIKEHFHIPTIVYGAGNPRLEHTENEFIEIEEFLNSIKIYQKFFVKFFEIWIKNKNRD